MSTVVVEKERAFWPAVMLDIETLGTGERALVLEIGAMLFDLVGQVAGPVFRAAVSLESNRGREVDPETLEWWMDRWRNGAKVPELGDVALEDALKGLKAFVEGHGQGDEMRVWCRGGLDVKVLEHAYRQAGMECPWEHYQVENQRSILRWEGVEKTPAEHGAVEDAALQVMDLMAAWREKQVRAAVELDFKGGWDVYREELAGTQAYPLPGWEALPGEVREAWCAAVRRCGEESRGQRPETGGTVLRSSSGRFGTALAEETVGIELGPWEAGPVVAKAFYKNGEVVEVRGVGPAEAGGPSGEGREPSDGAMLAANAVTRMSLSNPLASRADEEIARVIDAAFEQARGMGIPNDYRGEAWKNELRREGAVAVLEELMRMYGEVSRERPGIGLPAVWLGSEKRGLRVESGWPCFELAWAAAEFFGRGGRSGAERARAMGVKVEGGAR